MAKRRKKKVGVGDLVTIKCTECPRSYTTKKTDIRKDGKCWFCAHGIKLASPST